MLPLFWWFDSNMIDTLGLGYLGWRIALAVVGYFVNANSISLRPWMSCFYTI